MTGKWIRRRLTHNLGWKLASLLLAFLLWFAVVGEPELVAIQPVPLLYRNLPPNFLLAADAPAEVRAELRGPAGKLTREALAEVFGAVDLAGVTNPGTETFTLSASDFTLPQRVSFLRVVPSQVSLSFDRRMTKTVVVEPQFKGSLPSGFRLAAQGVLPETLQISGPEGRVSAIDSAKTDPVDLSDLTQSVEMKVNAFVAEPRAQFDSPPVVTVRLTIEREGTR